MTTSHEGRAPRASIVMPTYKRPEMLREALGSALAQTMGDLEVLVCDNADQPEARAVVESFADDRVRYVGRPTNLGMIGNALDGFRRARGEFVVKLDDDDALVPDMLARLVSALDGRPEVTAAFGDVTLVDADGAVMTAETAQLRRDTSREGLRGGYHAPFSHLAAAGAASLAATVLRRSAIDWDTIPEWAGTSYDLYLVLQAAEDGAVGYYDPEPVVRYRIHGANDSVKNVVPSLEAAQRILRDARSNGHHPASPVYGAYLAEDHARLSREYLLAGDAATARRQAVLSLASRPTPAGAKALVVSLLPTGLGSRLSAARRRAYLSRQADRS